MRIDKMLWCIRQFKTRSLAAEACKKNRIYLYDDLVKPAKELTVGDEFTVQKEQIKYRFKILSFPKSRVAAKLLSLYIMNITPQEELDKSNMGFNEKNAYRERGSGRPTKKERRELDDFTDIL